MTCIVFSGRVNIVAIPDIRCIGIGHFLLLDDSLNYCKTVSCVWGGGFEVHKVTNLTYDKELPQNRMAKFKEKQSFFDYKYYRFVAGNFGLFYHYALCSG